MAIVGVVEILAGVWKGGGRRFWGEEEVLFFPLELIIPRFDSALDHQEKQGDSQGSLAGAFPLTGIGFEGNFFALLFVAPWGRFLVLVDGRRWPEVAVQQGIDNALFLVPLICSGVAAGWESESIGLLQELRSDTCRRLG